VCPYLVTLFWWRFVAGVKLAWNRGHDQDERAEILRLYDPSASASPLFVERGATFDAGAKKAKEIHEASFLLLMLAWVFFSPRSAQCLFPLLFSLFVSLPPLHATPYRHLHTLTYYYFYFNPFPPSSSASLTSYCSHSHPF